MDPQAPRIPDLELVRPIGTGGFGTVWLARNAATGRRCAVKLIPRRSAGGATDPAGREMVSLARLETTLRRRSPHLLEVHHVGRTEEFLFYVMDLADPVDGGKAAENGDSGDATDATAAADAADATYAPATLESRMRRGPLPPAECIEAARDLIAGLADLHDAGMVHRDVKPSNCLFVDGRLRLADFGLVARSGPDVSRIGTVKYMPPDGRMDFRADVWAAGLVIYEMVTGLPADRFPRPGPRGAEAVRDPVLAALLRVSLAACERDPDRRPADARALSAALEEEARRAQGAAGPRRRAVAVIAGLAAAAALIALAAILWRPGVPAVPAAPRVSVTFITEPLEAAVLVDGEPARDADGAAAVTPCTVDDLPSGPHRVLFRLPGRPDLDAGAIDFSRTHQVTAHWP